MNGNQYGNYIWAGTIGMTSSAYSNFATTAQMINSPFARQTAAMAGDLTCGYINTSPPAFDTSCPGGNNVRFVTHLYIMGFRFNPSGNYHLAASVLRNGGTTTTLTDSDEALLPADIVTRIIGAGSTTELTGPKHTVVSYTNRNVRKGVTKNMMLNGNY